MPKKPVSPYQNNKEFIDGVNESLINKISIEKLSDLKIIKVTVHQELILNEKKELYSIFQDELSKSDYPRLLVNISKVSESRRYKLADFIDMLGFFKKIKTQKKIKSAFLSSDNNGQHKVFGVFLEIITNVKTRHFIIEEEAISWLCEE